MQHMSYYVLIARFMPRVEIVQKQNSTVRRIYIQGHNGKVSSNVPYGGILVSDRSIKRLYYGVMEHLYRA